MKDNVPRMDLRALPQVKRVHFPEREAAEHNSFDPCWPARRRSVEEVTLTLHLPPKVVGPPVRHPAISGRGDRQSWQWRGYKFRECSCSVTAFLGHLATCSVFSCTFPDWRFCAANLHNYSIVLRNAEQRWGSNGALLGEVAVKWSFSRYNARDGFGSLTACPISDLALWVYGIKGGRRGVLYR